MSLTVGRFDVEMGIRRNMANLFLIMDKPIDLQIRYVCRDDLNVVYMTTGVHRRYCSHAPSDTPRELMDQTIADLREFDRDMHAYYLGVDL